MKRLKMCSAVLTLLVGLMGVNVALGQDSKVYARDCLGGPGYGGMTDGPYDTGEVCTGAVTCGEADCGCGDWGSQEFWDRTCGNGRLCAGSCI